MVLPVISLWMFCSVVVEGVKYQRPVNKDAIAFPDNIDKHVNDFSLLRKSGKELDTVPIEFIQQINNYTVQDLLINYVDDYEEDTFLANRFADDDLERSLAVTPKSAKCIPEMQTIKLIEKEEPGVFYLPTCTRIERCGGCCSHNLLACEPVETEMMHFRVIKTQYDGGRLKFAGKDIVHIEKHTKCQCGCKIKAKDCNKYQKYREEECRCICNNTDEETKCFGDTKRLWDSENCTCRCKEVHDCSTGYAFDFSKCGCAPKPKRIQPLIQRGSFNQQETIDYEDDY